MSPRMVGDVETAAVPPPGRVALVLGGGGGPGAAVVRALADRGWSVAIHAHAALAAARETAAGLEAAGRRALAVTVNLRDEGATRALVHRVADHFGRIDAVVSCVGIRRTTAFDELTADDLRAHLDVGCVGPVVVAQEAGNVMARQAEGGTIVLLGDAAAAAPQPGQLARALAGGTFPAAARALAAEFAAHGGRLRVHAVEPAADEPDDRLAATVLRLLESAATAAAGLTGRPSPPAAGS